MDAIQAIRDAIEQLVYVCNSGLGFGQLLHVWGQSGDLTDFCELPELCTGKERRMGESRGGRE